MNDILLQNCSTVKRGLGYSLGVKIPSMYKPLVGLNHQSKKDRTRQDRMRRNGMGQEWRTEIQTFTQPKWSHNYISISKPSNLQTKIFLPYLIVTWDHIKINHKKLSVWAHQPWPALDATDPSLLCTESGSTEVQVQCSLENRDRCVEMSAKGCKYAVF